MSSRAADRDRGATGSPTAPGTMPAAQANALAAVLAAEQAAVYAYGVVGAQGAAADRDDALAALQRHAARRDLVAARLSAAQRTPKPAPPAYQLPFAVATPAAGAQARGARRVRGRRRERRPGRRVPGRRAGRGEPLARRERRGRPARGAARAQTFPGMPERAAR